jgi:hypothetical protein
MSPAEVSRRTDMLGGCIWEDCAQVTGALVIICLVLEQIGLGLEDKAVVEGWRRLNVNFWWICDCWELIKEEQR